MKQSLQLTNLSFTLKIMQVHDPCFMQWVMPLMVQNFAWLSEQDVTFELKFFLFLNLV